MNSSLPLAAHAPIGLGLPNRPGQKGAPSDVSGYLAKLGWSDHHEPAVILNPESDLAALAAWCDGEMRSLEALARLLCCGPSGNVTIDREDLGALLLHRLSPLGEGIAQLSQRLNGDL